jgi:hypothetical protein
MGDALVIEEQAACRLADEYDAAQARDEVQARAMRDAEKANPGFVRKKPLRRSHFCST